MEDPGFASSGPLSLHEQAQSGAVPPLWTLGHVGWFQEWWIARNLQRQLGVLADPGAVRLAAAEPWADPLFGEPPGAWGNLWQVQLPDGAIIRQYLLATLEATLELLEKSPEDDAALYFFRLALAHEDMQGEALIVTAQTLGLPLRLPLVASMGVRPPVWVPATRWRMGLDAAGQFGPAASGFAFDNESPAFDIVLPEFEIDAQAVTWAQFVEFVDDGGYDRQELWQAGGWEWLQAKTSAEGRRGPRYVDQIGVASGAVMQTRFGKAMRMLGNQSATHVNWFEASAFARWAGRRLPAEVEWEAAAHTALRGGFRWGDVWEWTGSSFRAYSNAEGPAGAAFKAGPWQAYSAPHFGSHKVLRGASFATRARMKSPKFRHFARPERDDFFCGFRTCAL
jgi:ergothioneine biosynthesis protein EgtB